MQYSISIYTCKNNNIAYKIEHKKRTYKQVQVIDITVNFWRISIEVGIEKWKRAKSKSSKRSN